MGICDKGFTFRIFTSPLAIAAVLLPLGASSSALAQDSGFDGFYAGAGALGGAVSVCGDSSSLFGGSSFMGFNHVTEGGLVLGIEVEGALLDGTGRDDCTLNDTTGPIPRNVEVDLNWEASGRLRAGMLPTDTVMVYATGGLSVVDGDVTIRDPGDPTVLSDGNERFYGGVIGVGVEALLSPGFTLRAEVAHAFYPDGNEPIAGLPPGISAEDLDLSTTSATLSLLFRF